MNNREKVLNLLLRVAPKKLTNSEIGARTGIKPHQQVFQITQTLRQNRQITGRRYGKEWQFSINGSDKKETKALVKAKARRPSRAKSNVKSAGDSFSSKVVVSQIERVLSRSTSLISRLVSERKRFEDWLQIEVLRGLLKEHPNIEIEKQYPSSRERCDFWTPNSDRPECWIELKLCVTNYCASFANNQSSRPITSQISDILRDIQKLSRLPKKYERRVLVLAYPLPPSDMPLAWMAHLNKLANKAEKIDQELEVKLKNSGEQARIVGYSLHV